MTKYVNIVKKNIIQNLIKKDMKIYANLKYF